MRQFFTNCKLHFKLLLEGFVGAKVPDVMITDLGFSQQSEPKATDLVLAIKGTILFILRSYIVIFGFCLILIS